MLHFVWSSRRRRLSTLQTHDGHSRCYKHRECGGGEMSGGAVAPLECPGIMHASPTSRATLPARGGRSPQLIWCRCSQPWTAPCGIGQRIADPCGQPAADNGTQHREEGEFGDGADHSTHHTTAQKGAAISSAVITPRAGARGLSGRLIRRPPWRWPAFPTIPA